MENSSNSKNKTFHMEIVSKVLPTSARLGAHNPDIDSICQLCNNQAQETEFHLFCECPFARAVWFGLSLNNIISSYNSSTIISWIKWWITETNLSHLQVKISTILWFIWKYRCSVVFEKINPDPINLIGKINSFLQSSPSDTL